MRKIRGKSGWCLGNHWVSFFVFFLVFISRRVTSLVSFFREIKIRVWRKIKKKKLFYSWSIQFISRSFILLYWKTIKRPPASGVKESSERQHAEIKTHWIYLFCSKPYLWKVSTICDPSIWLWFHFSETSRLFKYMFCATPFYLKKVLFVLVKK